MVFIDDLLTPVEAERLHAEADRVMAKARGLEVIERHIKPEEMANATEAFLAGTAAEVTPVRQIDTHHFTPGPITERLLRDYEALVQLHPDEVAARADTMKSRWP